MEQLISGKAYMSNEAVNAVYDYTAREIDILVKIIFLISREKDENKRAFLTLSYLQLQPDGLNGSDYAELRAAFIGLMRKPMEVFYRESQTWFISAPICAATIKKNSGLIHVEIHPKMVNIICDIRREYTGVEIESVLKMRGKYAKRIYLLMCQFKSTGVRYLNVDELRKMLRLGDMYSNINDLKKRVIDTAIHEINLCTEINITYEANRQSRKITDLTFLISLRREAQEVSDYERQEKFMQRIGVTDWIIQNAKGTLRPDELHRLCYTVNLQKDKIRNPGAYMAKVLSEAGVNVNRKLSFQPQINFNENTASKHP